MIESSKKWMLDYQLTELLVEVVAGQYSVRTASNIAQVAASVNGDVVYSASWIRMADTLNTCFTNYLY